MRHTDSLKRYLSRSLCALALAVCAAPPAHGAGTTPLALQTQFDNTGQNPLLGCLLYFFVAGTTSTPQAIYNDFGLTQPAPNPLTCSAGGRVPQHWTADGLVHIRLTDQTGLVVLDTTLQTLGPSSGTGGGGGGGGVDPNGVASTGDVKFRLSSEILSGWVILNGLTIGAAASGATQRANADTQNLFVYLWQNCTNFHCPVPGGRGANALADFNANKQIALPDMRSQMPVGRDCMNGTCAGVLLGSNINSGHGDGVDTPGAAGGGSNINITESMLPSVNDISAGFTSTGYTNGGNAYGASVTGGTNGGTTIQNIGYGGGNIQPFPVPGEAITVTVPTASVSVSGSTANASLPGGGQVLPLMNPFTLGTYYMKL